MRNRNNKICPDGWTNKQRNGADKQPENILPSPTVLSNKGVTSHNETDDIREEKK